MVLTNFTKYKNLVLEILILIIGNYKIKKNIKNIKIGLYQKILFKLNILS